MTTFEILIWPAGYRAHILVDGYMVERAFFFNWHDATLWAKARIAQMAEEQVRL
jgi:hypothetical protein